MIKNGSSFIKSNDNLTIWRYFNFTKFIDLIDSEEIFFCRLDKQIDPYEGLIFSPKRSDLDDFYRLTSSKRKYIFVNCWHINKYESAAMWDLYLDSVYGVAIKTQLDKVTKAFEITKDIDISIVKMSYLDFDEISLEELILNDKKYNPASFKRNSFSYENELRLVYVDNNIVKPIDIKEEPPAFLKVKVNISALIEKIYVSPKAPAWFGNLLASIIDKYNLNIPLEKSTLYERPELK